MTELALALNNLTGSITSIVKLEKLFELYLSDNLLTGTIPIQIGLMENLEKLSLSQNYLSGEIPLSLMQTDLVDDEGLYLEENCDLYTDEAGVKGWIVDKSHI